MREQQSTRCAIFGQHPICFDWGFDEEDEGCRNMKQELLQQIMALRQCGVTQFYVACDFGVGLYAAEQINVLRETDPDLMLYCVTPHEEHATKWAPYLRERYFDMLVKCTHISSASPYEQPKAQLLAYKKIIDQADIVLTVYGIPATRAGRAEDQAMLYAIGSNKPIIKIDPYTLTVKLLRDNYIEI